LVYIATACAAQLVLILDGLDQLSEAKQRALLDQTAAFALRHECVVVATSTHRVNFPPTISPSQFELGELTKEQRESVFRFYAATGELTDIAEAFTTVQDIKIAASVVSSLSANTTVAQAYDTCFRKALKQRASIGMRVLWRIGYEFFSRLSLFLDNEQFDQRVGELLRELQLPESWIDELKRLPLFKLGFDGVSFNHESIVRHLAAGYLVTTYQSDPTRLIELLRTPLFLSILEAAVSRVRDGQLASSIVLDLGSQDLGLKALHGSLGITVQKQLHRNAINLVSEIQLEATTISWHYEATDDKFARHFKPVVNRAPALNQRVLLDLIIKEPGEFGPALALALRSYGERMRDYAKEFSRGKAEKARKVLDGLLGEELFFTGQNLSSQLLAAATEAFWASRRGNKVALLAADEGWYALDGNPVLALCRCTALAQSSCDNVEKLLARVEDCWNSGVNRVMGAGIELLEAHQIWLTHQPSDVRDQLCAYLDAKLGINLYLNTFIFPVLDFLGGLDCGVSDEAAKDEGERILRELKGEILPSPEMLEVANLGLTINCRAAGFIGRMVAEFGSRPYMMAFGDLTEDDKILLLESAALAKESSSDADFILRELIRYGRSFSVPAFAKYCYSPPEPKMGDVNESELFAWAVIGLARLGAPLPNWKGGTEGAAWRIMREILYAEFSGAEIDENTLWRELETEDPLGGCVAFLELLDNFWLDHGEPPLEFTPEKSCPLGVKRILEIGVKNWSRLPFRAKPGFKEFQTVCKLLIEVGDEETVGVLEDFVFDANYGQLAIKAIRALKDKARI
jgi:hypothetical protein